MHDVCIMYMCRLPFPMFKLSLVNVYVCGCIVGKNRSYASRSRAVGDLGELFAVYRVSIVSRQRGLCVRCTLQEESHCSIGGGHCCVFSLH